MAGACFSAWSARISDRRNTAKNISYLFQSTSMQSLPQTQKPKLSKADQLRAEQELTLSTVVMQQIQLQRTLWLAVKVAGGRLTIDQAEIDPLWDLKFERPDKENPNQVVISASKLSDPTDEQLQKLASLLLGTPDHPQKAQDQVGLPDHPTQYLVNRIVNLVTWHGGRWIRREDYDALPADQKQPTAPDNAR
jgi:hypothetical protein